ncbi:putative late blight resistance protein homolog R1A-10 [Henckelia pumila]|uniref:putative late blight resistance protein homolog R1A-10 n=1 Tax=Henckelia pumila TaxID=405737 RepID=UPI003C6DFBEE
MDDLWETKVWNDVKRFFPDDNNGSRIIVTTRLTSVGVYAASDNHVLKLNLLSSRDSWNLLRNQVFGEESCPHYLAGIGQEVARYCQGLPLSIVVIGGLLSVDKTVEYWETISSSVHTLIATEDGQCSKILSLSYNHLPAHLKPCFLYFAVFPEDYDICRANLIKLWIAEGFLKPENSNSLEDVAERYLEDLVSRSLIMVFRLGYSGKVKKYRIHDLLRDFCVVEAQKTKFFVVTNRYSRAHPKDMKSERRVSICQDIPLEDYFSDSNGPAFLTLSIHCFHASVDFPLSKLVGFRLLRILNIAKMWLDEFPIEVVRLVHLRYLSLVCYQLIVPSSISSIWGLQTLILDTLGFNYSKFHLPLEVWKMPLLRHVQIEECYLPDPPCSKFESKNFVAMSNLQTLSVIVNFRFSGENVKRLPKLKKLKVLYDVEFNGWKHYHLSNIVCLNELETLEITSLSKIDLPEDFKFPSSLKKLNLSFCHLSWEDLAMAGSLPNLEVLILRNNACKGKVWEPNEGEFCEQKLLRLQGLDLLQWRADGSHFPKLRFFGAPIWRRSPVKLET